MNIAGVEYSFLTKGLDIYVSGCNGPHCTGCHNPETWSFNFGYKYDDTIRNKITTKIYDFNDMIDNIFIFGGEPLDQNHDELNVLLLDVKQFNKTLWLFTRYDFKLVPTFVKELCDYVKCGRYIEGLKTDDNIQYGIKLATSNQMIYKV
jgi:anaerobic ribonucleoside-triphosphate reductase activating protein